MTRPLRVGLLFDSSVQPAWVRRVVAELAAAPYAELALVIRNGAYRPTSLARQVRDYWRVLLPLLYDRLDSWLVRRWRRPDAFARVDLAKLLAGVPLIEVRPIQKRFSDYFPDADLAQIRGYDLDVALRFGFRILRGGSLEIARHGVWSYHHADNLALRGGPNSFWEVMQARPATGVVLQRLTDELDAGQVLARSWSRTNPLSLSLNRNAHYWKAASLVGRLLRDLHRRGPAALEQDLLGQSYQPYSERIYTRPGNLASLPLLARLGGRLARAGLAHALTEERSTVYFGLARRGEALASTFHALRPLPARAGTSLSEPFPIRRGAGYAVFVTEQTRGAESRLAVVELGADGAAGPLEPVLSAPGGLSYPAVSEWRDELYLLPERSARGDLLLYRLRRWPDQWEPATALLERVRASHATLAELDGHWWLFVNLAEEGASTRDELHLFWSASPLGPWQPHPRNPLRSDARAARMAGRPFHWHGGLYRPGQDCTVRDGSAIVIHRIERLAADEYVEREVARLLPRWQPGLVANRVLNQAGPLTCLDGVRVRPRWAGS